jgi:hypothetical protein
MASTKQMRRATISEMSFVKELEMALRFGTPILLEDVDGLDPILNPILNGEFKRVDGNVFVRLGEHDVPFSPSFMLYMATRDPNARFTPDLCSRYWSSVIAAAVVVVVNFLLFIYFAVVDDDVVVMLVF